MELGTPDAFIQQMMRTNPLWGRQAAKARQAVVILLACLGLAATAYGAYLIITSDDYGVWKLVLMAIIALSVVLYAVNIIDVDRRWLVPDNEA